MQKNLSSMGRTSGVILISALALQGCSLGSTPSQSPNPATTRLSPTESMAMKVYFEDVVSRYSNLSAQEKDVMFVDRDVKGNRLANSAADAPTAPVWAHKDFEKDGIPGTGTERAYAELNLTTKGAPVVVAVIDSAIDIDHVDLKENIWTNPTPDPKYPAAVHGWNFLGGADGNIYHTTLELTREVRRMRALKQNGALDTHQQAYLDKLEEDFVKGKGDAAGKLVLRTKARDQLQAALDVLKAHGFIKDGTLAEVQAIQSDDDGIKAARDAALISLKQGRDLAWYKSSIDHWTGAAALNDQYYYNVDFDSSTVVGDHPEQLDEVYGNGNVKPQDAGEIHATHVAGIIGALRGNSIGMDGQAANVRIMSLRAVPDGDERDKDIGNAIRFAADHGARIINMSFGKSYSPHAAYVWDAIKYAGSKQVLIVHAAGNDSTNNDLASHYPDREIRDEDRNLVETLPNVIEVGASSVNKDKNLPASFSEYGSRTVDLFAPGAQIYSTVPGDHYAELDGTSMATPEVAGVAALVLSQHPCLTALQLKDLLMGNVTSFKGLMVVQPNPDPSAPESLVDFGVLSIQGGIVSAYQALKTAAQLGL